MTSTIIDVSEHQGKIDWGKVNGTVDAVIIRCGYGQDIKSQDDKQWKNNVKGAIKYGIPFGVYLYSYAKTCTAARSEANHVLRLLKPYRNKIALPVFYDLEQSGTEKYAKETYKAFKEVIEKNGYHCVPYSSEWWWKNYLIGLNEKEKWVAKYGVDNGFPNSKPKMEFSLWQYTSKGRVPGIATNVDMNLPTKAFVDKYINGKPVKEPVVELKKAKVTAVSGLNCRKYPTVESTTMGAFCYGTEVDLLEPITADTEWVKVKGKDVKGEITIGYCYVFYLKEEE